jgi:hypothetical protein
MIQSSSMRLRSAREDPAPPNRATLRAVTFRFRDSRRDGDRPWPDRIRPHRPLRRSRPGARPKGRRARPAGNHLPADRSSAQLDLRYREHAMAPNGHGVRRCPQVWPGVPADRCPPESARLVASRRSQPDARPLGIGDGQHPSLRPVDQLTLPASPDGNLGPALLGSTLFFPRVGALGLSTLTTRHQHPLMPAIRAFSQVRLVAACGT